MRTLGVAGAAWAGASCNQSLDVDTTRHAPPKATLGDDIFGALCDRVGASSLAEDLEGLSYQAVCHYDAQGHYQDKVNTALLPPVTGKAAAETRRLGIAKVETMARRRGDLVHALNAAFPDIDIDNVATSQQGDTVRLHDALIALTQSMASLYDTNPYDAKGAPLVPESTRALGRLFDAFHASDAARTALSNIWGRQGYRPPPVSLGGIRSALAYPGLRSMAKATLDVLGPKGTATPALQQLFTVGKQEMLAIKPTEAALPRFTVDGTTAQPNRPRSTVELASSLLLSEDPSFAASDMAPHSYIARRDKRGFVVTTNAQGAPFADRDGDGYADVDIFGRFIDAQGAPLTVDPPFVVPGVMSGPVDEFGRPQSHLYGYVDTSRSLANAATRTLQPLLDATQYVAPGTPEAWKSEHEALMYAVAGAYVLLGDREQATYDYESDSVRPAGETCARCIPYLRFRGEDSPLADLAHAAGQLLADKDSDALLLGVIDLVQNHEDVVARLVGSALHARDLAAAHDDLAAQGKEALAQIPYETPIWDELAEVVGRIVDHTGLLARLVQAFSDDAMVTPHGSIRHFGDGLAALLSDRDKLTYNPDDLNGPAINLTVGAPSTADPKSPVDQTKPKVGDNRSCAQRVLQTISDAYTASACNKDGSKLTVNGISLPGSFALCDLFQIEDLAAFYLDTMLPDGHPKRAKLVLKPRFLSILINFAQGLGLSLDGLLENGSKIDGMTLTPTSAAVNRFFFYGADSTKYPAMPDLDPNRTTVNRTTNIFVSNLFEPASSALCPKNALGANDCANKEDTVRLRDANTLFLFERFGLYDYMRPLMTALAELGPDLTGEKLLLDLLSVANRHWAGKEHGPECNSMVTPETNPRYCSGAGVNTYEPLAADILRSDILPAVQSFSKLETGASKITVQRGPKAGQVWTGADVLEKMARILFSKDYAASVKMVDRKGSKATTWVNGKPQDQLTLFSLLADGLHKIDVQFDKSSLPDAKDRKAQWKRARSELADAFLAVEGDGPNAHFKNRAIPKMLVSTLQLVREQLNAHCPDRETTGSCDWARKELGDKVAKFVSNPLFAALVDIGDALRANEPARRETEKLLSYLLTEASSDVSFQAMLASLTDFVQVLSNDDILSPILQAAANASSPDGDKDGPGAADTGLKVLKALTDDRYDKYHALDHVLTQVVTPLADGRAPIQVFLDVIADVNRIDAESTEPLTPDDYKTVFATVRDLMTDKTRGLEQIYYIVQHRAHE